MNSFILNQALHSLTQKYLHRGNNMAGIVCTASIWLELILSPNMNKDIIESQHSKLTLASLKDVLLVGTSLNVNSSRPPMLYSS